ncbi:MAG: UDP-glucose 4-epimerase GalE [Cyclobacteriaceae bacterium]|nr:UDP-glucose 4-epimerase GalE [Cyclobacteriaceae bacterium]
MEKILITGGAGFIGSHTVVELTKAGYSPVIVDDFSNSNQSAIRGIESIIKQSVKVYEGDCNDAQFMNDLFVAEQNITGVIHFAAYKAVGESVEKPLQYYQNNVGSLMVLLDVMKKNGVENVVFSSSCTVYGEPDQLPVTEKSPIKPAESPYGNTKQVCEEILEDVIKSDADYKAIALRYFNPIGAHPSSHIGELPLGVPNNLIPFVTQTAAGHREQLTIFGDEYDTPDGTCVRDYIHVVDLAKAHVKALQHFKNQNTPYYDVFNIGTGKGNSVLEVVKTFEKVSEQKLKYKIGDKRTGDVEQVFGDVEKANNELHWKAALTLEDALRDAWNWQKKLK